jgi:CubicO group peptidase (beta-lactamase class C family)
VSSTRLERAIDFIRQEVENGTVPGAVLVATRNGSKFVEFACGTYCSCTERARPMGPEVVNACYSFSKVVSATVIATVIQEGLLDLDEPVKTYIPEFAGGGKDSITLRHLLTHAAGIPSAPVGGAVVDTASWERAVAAACAAEVEWEPGSRTAYHGLSGQFVAAEAVRRVLGGELWDEICRERLFRPLGMETFTFGLPPCSEDIALTPQPGELPFALEPASLGMAGHPGGGGFGRPEDMLRLLNLHLAGGVWNGKRLLAPEMFREMHRLQYADRIATATGRDERPAHENWGLGWLLRGDSQEHWFGFGNRVSPRTFSHAGINTVIGLADPETGMALVFLTTNSPPTDQDTVRLRNTVTNLVADALED